MCVHICLCACVCSRPVYHHKSGCVLVDKWLQKSTFTHLPWRIFLPLCVCVVSVSLRSHMRPLIRWVSVHGQDTSLYSPERVTARPLATSTSEPPPSAPLCSPTTPPPSSAPSLPPSLSVSWKHAASRQTRQRLTDTHTHRHRHARSQHGQYIELDPRPTGRPGPAGCVGGGAGVCKSVYVYVCVCWCHGMC